MTFLQLNYIMEIINCGSINKAAQNLFVSQSTISSSIKELEEEIGTTIFRRSNRGIELTDDGKEFVHYIRPILEQEKKIRSLYANKSTAPTSRLNVSTQRYPFCAKAFVNFLKQQPEKFEFRFKESGMFQCIEDVYQRQSEVAIIYISTLTEKFMKKLFYTKDMAFCEIKRVKPHVFLSRQHPLAGSSAIMIEDLRPYPFLSFLQGENESVNFSEEGALSATHSFDKIIHVNDRATIYNIISHTDAFTAGSGLLEPGFYDPNIISIPIADETDEMRIGWIRLKGRELSPAAEHFINLLQEIL